MNGIRIDLRSDTVTKPSSEMRAAMAGAEVGDDVYGEDPTVNRLQEKVAVLLGKEAALFVPSGTMSNQIAIKCLTQPGDEIICEYESHIYTYEASGPAFNSLVMPRPVKGHYGVMAIEDVVKAIRPDNIQTGRTSLIEVENTHNRAGGTIYPLAEIEKLTEVANEHHIAMHLDGARLMNASVSTGIAPAEYAKYFDSVSLCLSKGLGAPIGSVLSGSRNFIAKALRVRKIFGGAMRQVGILAAAGLYALDHNVQRLQIDHENARLLAQGLSEIDGLYIDKQQVQTNMVMIYVRSLRWTTEKIVQQLLAKGVGMNAIDSERIRAVTHLDVRRDQILEAIEIFKKIMEA
ncbi:MAG TPA: low-specificity L-threonine aldolase [Candidatus Marinimicrobia bacterium]|nr:low-specificity L-threonine aldolase [Candidatus Neomarinimicrobiota bacterium]HRS51623.1 low-specificity L-threonine aldolase [Candidatus Neomarinimicrobiota bacterium]HRU92299.1 low-specificity L-threonine aldolase [Candidatus Neomarinimicrobiota bacterium]